MCLYLFPAVFFFFVGQHLSFAAFRTGNQSDQRILFFFLLADNSGTFCVCAFYTFHNDITTTDR